jgi:hypothetical protein
MKALKPTRFKLPKEENQRKGQTRKPYEPKSILDWEIGKCKECKCNRYCRHGITKEVNLIKKSSRVVNRILRFPQVHA